MSFKGRLRVTILATLLTLALILSTGVLAQDQEYRGPEFCSACHPSQYESQSSSIHAYAFEDPIFQSVWESEGKPSFCLKCHTTGYNPETGEYAFPGVTCEACHGPGMTMNVTLSASLCGGCHTGAHHPTYDEWLESGHSEAFSSLFQQCFQTCHNLAATGTPELVEEYETCLTAGCHSAEMFLLGQKIITEEDLTFKELNETLTSFIENPTGTTLNPITCQACHDPHEVGNKFQGLEMKLTVDAEEPHELCMRCHDVPSKLWSANSPHKLGGANCITCHMATKPYEAEEPESKWANTGHTFEVWSYENGTLAACLKCHDLKAQDLYVNVLNVTGAEKYSALTATYSEVKEYLETLNSTLYQMLAEGKPVKPYIKALEGLLEELGTVYLDIRTLGHEGSNGLHNFAYFVEAISNDTGKLLKLRSIAETIEELLGAMPRETITETVTRTKTVEYHITTTTTETETLEKTHTTTTTKTVERTTTETVTRTETVEKTSTKTLEKTLTETVTVTEATGYYLAAVLAVIAIALVALLVKRR